MDKALYDKGMAMRRKVLGDEYVDRAVANTDDFNRKFQDCSMSSAGARCGPTRTSSRATAACSISA